MRIIGGTHRSRELHPPRDNKTTRPITDRAKQSLFDRLWSLDALGEGNVLDIFAGTGSLGIEALSRGAEHCTFIEKDRAAKRLLEENLDELEMRDRAAVMSVDALSTGWIGVLPRKPLRVVFCDPPYGTTADEAGLAKVVTMISSLATPGIMEPLGLCVLRTQTGVEAPAIDGWDGPKNFPIGSMMFHFYQRTEATEG